MSGIPTRQDYQRSKGPPTSKEELANAWERDRHSKVGRPSRGAQTDKSSEELDSEAVESARSALLAQIGRKTSHGLESYITAGSNTLTRAGMLARGEFEQGLRYAATSIFSSIINGLTASDPDRVKQLAIEYPMFKGQRPWDISFSHESASGETAAASASATSDAEGGDPPEKDTSTYNVYVHSNGPSEFNVGEHRVVGKTTKADISKFGLVSKTSAA